MKSQKKGWFGFLSGPEPDKPEGNETRREEKPGSDDGPPVKKPGGSHTYRNEEAGYVVDVPGDWSLPAAGTLEDIECLPDEAIEFTIHLAAPEPLPDYTEREFASVARDRAHTDLEFGRILAGGREQVWVRYTDRRGDPAKTYIVVLGGMSYVMTATAANRTVFARREKVWDRMVESFRLTESREQDIADLRAHRIDAAGQLYGLAYDAVSEGRYSEARDLLLRCITDDPDHVLAHKELAMVLKRMGDLEGALNHRMDVKRLNPDDVVNRYNLAMLLGLLGSKDEAIQEAEWLVATNPREPRFQALKMALEHRPLTFPQHYNEECQEQPGPKRDLKLFRSVVLDIRPPAMLILEYKWVDALPADESERLCKRAIAYVACGIYDAAFIGGLHCQPSPIPHGRRPAWLVEGWKMPIALVLSDTDVVERICQMTIGVPVFSMDAPPIGGPHWETLLAGLRIGFGRIRV
jgi:tetratricopeptide (TPR) repeat protein